MMDEQMKKGHAAYMQMEDACDLLVKSGNWQRVGASDIRLFLDMYTQALLLRMAASQLNAREQADFAADMEKLTDDSLSRVAGELEWFTLKFDYRNADKPWGNSRDALERAVTKLRGWCVGAEPGAKK